MYFIEHSGGCIPGRTDVHLAEGIIAMTVVGIAPIGYIRRVASIIRPLPSRNDDTRISLGRDVSNKTNISSHQLTSINDVVS